MAKKIFIGIALLFFTFSYSQKEFYELRTYELNFGKSANLLYDYIEKALIPALNKNEIYNIGVFEEIGDAMPKKLYLFIPYKSINDYYEAFEGLKEDQDYKKVSNSYMKTSPNDFPYLRYETSLFIAFEGLPKMIKPDEGTSVFELRTYEGYNEDALNRKIRMFNESEFKIFEDVGLHSVFFGEKIAGPQMPCLTYMLAFKDMEERNANWEKFGPHPEWQRIFGLPEYENTVSNIYRIFLKPMSFSKL
ncbi:NIPSNAP family protein [Gaetbulibacter aquiaggeris]|uniref:NIPSNAP family protein n=1 Tax=Gaetbulibacter aquiaggeris TaxID=1735373 RepID=A0ABW7MLE3_9FLAO